MRPMLAIALLALGAAAAPGCKMSDWSSYTACTRSCNGGTQYATRSVITLKAGAFCGHNMRYRNCNSFRCLASGESMLNDQMSSSNFKPESTDSEEYGDNGGKTCMGGKNLKLDSRCTKVRGYLSYDNTDFETLDFLRNVKEIVAWKGMTGPNGASIYIANNRKLRSISGLNLNAAGGNLIIENNPKLVRGSMKATKISGNVWVKSNSQMKKFDLDCESILGDVNIQKNNVLVETKILVRQAKGALKFKNNKMLKEIKLPQLTTTGVDKDGSSLVITGNDKLETLLGLRSIQGILKGAMTISNNKALKNLDGLNNVLGLGRDSSHRSLSVSGNDALNNMMGLSGLKGKVPGSISLDMNPSLKVLAGFQQITEVGADLSGKSLTVAVNKIMTDFLGFENLVAADGAMSIRSNPELTVLNGLRNLRSIDGKDSTTGDSLEIKYNPKLASAQLLKLVTTKGGIVIEGNPSLKNLIELASDLQTVGGEIVVKDVKCLGEDEFAALKRAGVKTLAKATRPTCTLGVTVGTGQGQICGGTAGGNWNEWKAAGSTGLYLDVDTRKCKFGNRKMSYVTSVVGDSAHWQLVGINSIYSATPTGFRVYVWHPVMRGHFMRFFAQKYKWKLNWLADTGKTSGITAAGATGWKSVANTKNVLYADVDTSASGFKGTPRYISAIHGGSNHWRVTGSHAVYNPTSKSFRMYVVYPSAISPALAEANAWTIAFVGSEDATTGGSSTDKSWKPYLKAQTSGTKGKAVSVTVDTSAGEYNVMPTYVTSLTGNSHHLWATGAGSIYSATARSFKVYLDNVPTIAAIKKQQWVLNYVAYAQPKDCQISAFGPWSSCTRSCGAGHSRRERAVVISAYFGGKCPQLVQTKKCNEHACPVDCVYSKWGAWSECSLSCGPGGEQKRTRGIKSNAKHGGKDCATFGQVQSCHKGPCPIHCQVTAWSKWEACPRTCGGATVKRTRTVTRYNKHGGVKCPSLEESQSCNTGACPVDCTWGAWGKWSACSVTCGTGKKGLGTQFRFRKLASPPQHGGKACVHDTHYRTCSSGACPVHCSVSAWSAWSSCTKTCGEGTTKRSRSIIMTSAYGGVVCPKLAETNSCNKHTCPVDCEVSVWSKAGGCSKTCGTGKQGWRRTIMTNAGHGGVACPPLSKKSSCNTNACPIDCVLHAWSAWSACTKTCGTGQQQRSRGIRSNAQHGGKACSSERAQSRPCDAGKCPVHCVVSGWSNWSPCTKSCGTGAKARSRKVVRHPLHGGYTCPSLAQTADCNVDSCPIDCVQSGWTSFGACSKSCGAGTQTRARTVVRTAAYGGAACGPSSSSRRCNAQACPVDCVATGWSSWSACTVSCAIGSQSRTRSVTSSAQNGGKRCGAMKDSRACDKGPCPIHCKVGAWGQWGSCSKTCGGGRKARSRSITTHAAHGGVTCPSLTDNTDCNTFCCPVNCRMSSWSGYGSCTKSCGAGKKTKTRTVLVAAKCGAAACGATSATASCNGFSCPVDCALGNWNAWQACSVTCGGGTQKRARPVTTQPQHGGQKCQHTSESQACGQDKCPVHCKVSAWSTWGSCSKTCGGGVSKRSRSVVVKPEYGGTICPDLDATTSCQRQQCPVDCQVGAWSEWYAYANGKHMLKRVRAVTRYPSFGGKKCPGLVQTKSHSEMCKNTVVYGQWSSCTRRCGTGRRFRQWERIHCSHSSTLKYHLKMQQSEHCNEQECTKGEAKGEAKVAVPAITTADKVRSGIPVEFSA